MNCDDARRGIGISIKLIGAERVNWCAHLKLKYVSISVRSSACGFQIGQHFSLHFINTKYCVALRRPMFDTKIENRITTTVNSFDIENALCARFAAKSNANENI